MLEQQIDLVDKDIGFLSLCSVLCNAVENTVHNDKHTERHKMFTEVENIVANQAVVCIDIGFLCKGIERAFDIQLNIKRNIVSLRLRLS